MKSMAYMNISKHILIAVVLALAALPASARAAQRPGLMMGALYRALLDKIAAQDFAVLHQRVRLSTLQKLTVAARFLIA